MTPDKEGLIETAEAILEGREVDWDELRRSATTGDVRKLVTQLEALEAISRGHMAPDGEPASAEDSTPDALIDEYRIAHELEENLVIVRYEVVHRQTGVRSTLSLVKWDVDARGVLAAFTAQKQRLQGVSSPNLGVVFEAGVTPEGRLYFVEPLMRGATLVRWAREGGQPLASRLGLVIRASESLGSAHRRGVAHGTLTPLSVLAPDEESPVRIVGLGLSSTLDLRALEQRVAARTQQQVRFEHYLAPEQREPGSTGASASADVFALGALIEDLVPESERSGELQHVLGAAREANPHCRIADGLELARQLVACKDLG